MSGGFLLGVTLGAALLIQEPAPQTRTIPQATSNAAPASNVPPSAATPSDLPTQTPSRPTTLPFVLRDNLVTIDTTINGRPQRAILDSGAAGLILDQGFARNLGIDAGRPVGNAAGGGEQAQQLRSVDVRSLVVGPYRFEHIPGYSLDLQHLSSSTGFPVELLVGAPAFKHGVVAIDYRRREVTFGPTGSGRRCAAPMPLTIVEDIPVVDVLIRPTPGADPARLRLAVDLGTRHQAVFLGGPFVRSEAGRALIRSGTARQVGQGIGGAVQGSIARIAELRIGPRLFSDLEVALSSGAPAFEAGVIDGSLGVPLWGSGVITFDYPAGTLCIER